MNIALFAAVPDEVGDFANKVNFTGIGRENTTRAMIRFMNRHAQEDFVMLNLGTVGSPDMPAGALLGIREVLSGGAGFYSERMLPASLGVPADAAVRPATLYSSDSFVSPGVYAAPYLAELKSKVDCFDMESSVLVSFAHEYGKEFVSYKIVSDNLDVDIEVWKLRVRDLSKVLVSHVRQVLRELEERGPVGLIVG